MDPQIKQPKILTFALAAIFLSLLTPPTAFPSNGILLLVEGKVNISFHGATSPARTGVRVQPGVTVESLGGSAVVLLRDGSVAMVREGSAYTVPEETDERPRDPVIAKIMDTIRETAHRGRGPGIETVERAEDEIRALYPANSLIDPGDLRFQWEGVRGVEDAEVTLQAPSPVYRYVIRVAPGKNSCSLPETAPVLLPDVRYYWKVRGYHKAKGAPYTSRLSWFAFPAAKAVLDLANDMKRIDEIPDLEAKDRQFLQASLLIAHGLHHRAVALLKMSVDRSPDDQGLKEILTGLYLKMKLFGEAEKTI